MISGQVDLWTRKSSGCTCAWENMENNNSNNSTVNDSGLMMNISANSQTVSSPQNCACCVKGGCQCETPSPTRCGQCGLQQYCINSKCNLYTISEVKKGYSFTMKF